MGAVGTERVNVSMEGEVSVMNAPPHYSIRVRALRVMVPAQSLRPGGKDAKPTRGVA